MLTSGTIERNKAAAKRFDLRGPFHDREQIGREQIRNRARLKGLSALSRTV